MQAHNHALELCCSSYLALQGTKCYTAHMSEKETQEQLAATQMRKGLLEFCILAIIAENEVYTTDILTKLKRADLIVVEGTLYPLLSRLRSDGLLKYRWEESDSGPPRKYYSLTDKGTAALARLKLTWKGLTASINALIT